MKTITNRESTTLTAARGIAILLVIVLHSKDFFLSFINQQQFNEHVNSQMSFLNIGASRVGLFFFISGFLLYKLQTIKHGLKFYTLKRASRIAPLWVFWFIVSTIAATFAIKWWFPVNHPLLVTIYGAGFDINKPELIIPALIYVVFLGWFMPAYFNNAIPGGWSIQMEVINYVLFPVFKKIGFTAVFILLSILHILYITVFQLTYTSNRAALLADIQNNIINPLEMGYLIITSLFWFVLGMYTVKTTENVKPKLKSETVAFAILSILTISTSWLAHPEWYPSTQLQTLAILIATVCFSWFISKQNGLTFKALEQISKYSYGMYFAHFLIAPLAGYYTFTIIQNFTKSDIIVWLGYIGMLTVTIIASLFVSVITNKLIEKPFQVYKTKTKEHSTLDVLK